jgi:BirA family biotin operon repressor/biotin-[acetyl-CoA-carboxylase] ligase
VSIDTPRPPLDTLQISEKISRYWRVSVVEVTGSTQDDLLNRIAKSEARIGDVLVTDYQSAGRGRLDRKFEAPATSALLFSFYIEPKREQSEWSLLPLIVGLSASHALSAIDPRIQSSLKWPNDLHISGLKVGGIIAHAITEGVVIGVGINVGMTESELPTAQATSLALKNFGELNRNTILAAFLNEFEDLLARWEAGEDLRHLYLERCSSIGVRVEAELPGGVKKSGVATNITPQGELILEDGSRITVGDIVHLR